MRYLVEMAYQGTNYSGWQRQPNAVTVQEVIESKLSGLLKFDIGIMACGRTDATVHAGQSFFHFDSEAIEDLEFFRFKLNKILPPDISITAVLAVSSDFHSRFDATFREYKYYVTTEKDPFLQDRAWLFPYNQDLNIDLINEAAGLLLEYDDFFTFSKSKTDVTSYICKMKEIYWQKKSDHLYEFTISANRFLRGMVRLIVGMNINYMRSKITLIEIREALDQKKRMKLDLSVPGHGLYLNKVLYNTINHS